MKISKLFHWLYGILMLLPCFAILVKCAYVAFNKNAYESFTKKNTYTQLSTITNLDNLIEGQECYVNIEEIVSSTPETNYIKFTNWNISTPTNATYFTMGMSNGHTTNFGITFFDENKRYITQRSITNSNLSSYQNSKFIFLGTESYNYGTNNLRNFNFRTYLFQYDNIALDNVFYYAVDEVCNNELFAWASNSFLNAPLTYITNLFNMPTDNAVILLMSYWFNISIIWLCFDAMIYVPLLVHRWLDKGIVE